MFEDLTKAIEIIEQQYKVGIDYSKGADTTALCMVVGKQAEAVIKALSEYLELTKAKTEGRLVVLPETGIGDLSDGYHTFNELYHHRAILFSVICNEHPDISWKSKLHHDGTMFDGMFIVGINTPEGQATYHYDINPYWDMFRVRELEKAPEWDGHTSEQAIERIAGLTRETAEKVIPTCNVTKLPCARCNPVCEHREE